MAITIVGFALLGEMVCNECAMKRYGNRVFRETVMIDEYHSAFPIYGFQYDELEYHGHNHCDQCGADLLDYVVPVID